MSTMLLIASGLGHAGTMQKGPYLQNLAADGITIMWQHEPAEPAQLFVEGPRVAGGPVVVTEHTIAAARIAEADLTGLLPSTRYRYRVELDGRRYQGEFSTAPQAGSDVPFAFVVFGDTRDNANAHRRVVERIAQDVPDFVLGTGDMVDDGGVQEQWQTFFEVERVLLRDNVYFPAVGNHDRQGRGRTAESYRAFFALPDNGADSERYYAFTYANSRFLVLDSNAHSFSLTDQTAWLDGELAAARQDPRVLHVFVVMHHPPFSISLHGGQRDLRERWTPIFEKYAVSAVFSGHDHVYERAEHNGLRYFVSGGGGAPLYPKSAKASTVDREAVKYFERTYHHLRVNVTSRQVEVAAIRADGSLIESTLWREGAPPAGVATMPPIGGPTAELQRPPPTMPPTPRSRPAPNAPGRAPSLPWMLGLITVLMAGVFWLFRRS